MSNRRPSTDRRPPPSTRYHAADQPEETTASAATSDTRGSRYTAEELAWLAWVAGWQKASGRKFPSHVDYLRMAREFFAARQGAAAAGEQESKPAG